jgi:hypothetical protein
MFRRQRGAGISKSATSRHFVALSAARMKEWMGADLSGLDIMVVQIDGIHISEHLVLAHPGSPANSPDRPAASSRAP